MSLVAAGPVRDVRDVDNPYADVVIPPPAVRNIIDRTAQFVAQHGPEAEARMMREPNAQDRFGFLFPEHPYCAYYRVKIQEVKSGKVESVTPSVPEAVKVQWEREKEKQVKRLMLTNKAEGGLAGGSDSAVESLDSVLKHFSDAEDPQPLKFALTRPPITQQEEEIIKLTARFVARNGASFLTGLTHRERSNPQFEFLKPHHPSNLYFRGLVDGYVEILQRKDEFMAQLRFVAGLGQLPPTKLADGEPEQFPEPANDEEREEFRKRYLAARMLHRQKRQQQVDEEKKAQQEAEAEERSAMAAIDWDDIVVVETITFTQADQFLDLPGKVSLQAIPFQPVPDVPAGPTILPQPSPVEPAKPATQQQLAGPGTQDPTATTVVGTAKGSAGETKVVLAPGSRRPRHKPTGAGQFLKCPITGQLVPVGNYTQHLKVLLIDPQWKAQREDLLSRAKADSAYAPDADIEANIANFVIRRPDLFGTVEDEILEHSINDPTGDENISKRARIG